MKFNQNSNLRELNFLYREFDELYHEIALRMGLSDSAFYILYTICEMGEGCLQMDICRVCCMSKQTVNSSIRKLEQDGIVVRKDGKGRDRKLYLTEYGRQLTEERIFSVMRLEEAAFDGMTPEERRLLLALTRKYLGFLYSQWEKAVREEEPR